MLPGTDIETLEWICIEQASCKGTSLGALINSPVKIDTALYSGNIVIHNTLKVWKQIRSYLKIPDTYLNSPISNNHAFMPGTQDRVFARWKQKGLATMRDLYATSCF